MKYRQNFLSLRWITDFTVCKSPEQTVQSLKK